MAPPDCTCVHLSRVKNVNNSSILQQRNSWDALFSLGISPLSPLLFLTEGHSLCWTADREPWVAALAKASRATAKDGSVHAEPTWAKGTPPNSAKCAEEQGFPLHPQLSLFSHLVHLTIPCQDIQLRRLKRYIPLGHRKDKFSPLIPA